MAVLRVVFVVGQNPWGLLKGDVKVMWDSRLFERFVVLRFVSW